MNKYSEAREAVKNHARVTRLQTPGSDGVLERIAANRRFYEVSGPETVEKMLIDLGNLQAVLRTLSEFGGTIEQARALAAKAVKEME